MSGVNISETKLVSIVCPGHSGSTLLDMTLGTLPKVASCGEIVYLPWKIHKEGNPDKYITTYCSCGERTTHCSYWKPVLKLISAKLNIDIFNNPKKFNISILRPFYYGKNLKYTILKKFIELGSKYINVNIIISIFYPFYIKSIKNNWNLFDFIKNIHGKNIIIDSSKDIYRYLLLRKNRKNNIKLIILIRDVYGVSTSIHNNIKLTDKLIYSRARNWLRFYNEKVYNVIKYLDKNDYLIIRYEDLANNVNKTRKFLADFLNIKEKLSDIDKIYPPQMHILSGNPARNKKVMEIKYDQRWRNRLTEEQFLKLKKINNSLKPIFNNRI